MLRVAGPGFEPGSSGYEPDEIPLLYPAMENIISENSFFARGVEGKRAWSPVFFLTEKSLNPTSRFLFLFLFKQKHRSGFQVPKQTKAELKGLADYIGR